jgi:UDP:flavonoid glycosyltransferase YjiC (YdhE family)
LRVLFTSVSAYGHLHPLLPLARAAKAAGDDVIVATGADMVDWVTACGLEAVGAGHGGSATWTPEEHRQLERLGPDRPFHLFTSFLVPAMVDDLLRLCGDWAPDVIVHEETELAGPLVARIIDVPCVTHSYAAPARPLQDGAMMRELLQPIWAERGAGEPRTTGDRYLDACPPGFQSDAIDAIPNVQRVRPVGFDGPVRAPPSWVDRLARPCAYLTFGTVGAFSRVEVLQRCASAVAPEVAALVVTTGPNAASALRVPEHVVVEEYLPQSLVLGAADLVVSHGGAGTTLGAIEHGLPHVVVPQMPFSQTRNAERVEALGIGRHIDDGDEAALGAAVRQVLADPSWGERARDLRASLDRLPSPGEVASSLRELVA